MRLANFKASCGKITCGHVFDAPVLSDFSYGEFIYGSIDGKEIRYYSSLDCKTWDLIAGIVDERFSDKNDLRKGLIIQKIIGLVGDRQDTDVYFTQDIYCPKCQSKVDSIDDEDKTGLEDYASLTFNSFTDLAEFEQEKLINNHIKALD